MNLVVGDLLTKAAMAAPSRVAATLGEALLTYDELNKSGNQTANALIGVGVMPGDRCLVWSNTSLRYLEVFVGITRSGAVFVPVIATLGVDEVMPIVEYIRPAFIIADLVHQDEAESLAQKTRVPLIIFCSSSEDSTTQLPGFNLDQETVKATDNHSDSQVPGELDLHTIFLTSGSTGKPKGVMLNHRTNWLRIYAGAGPHMPAGGAGMVNMFPLSHFAGWHFVSLMWSRLRAVHLVERADAYLLMEAVQRWRANELYCIPAVWQRIIESRKKEFDLTSLKYANTGTSQTPVELLSSIKSRLPNTSTTVSYGATEVSTIATLSDDELFTHSDSVGMPAPGNAVRIADDGEVCVCSHLMMQGYFECSEETEKAIQNGWYYTGDTGELRDGYLSILGRKREIIRSGGETIIPTEVEVAVAGYPGILNVAVVGVPDANWGEIVTACVVMQNGAVAPRIDEIQTFLSTRLASFKHPRKIETFAEIPRTNATGQVQRAKLVRMLTSN